MFDQKATNALIARELREHYERVGDYLKKVVEYNESRGNDFLRIIGISCDEAESLSLLLSHCR